MKILTIPQPFASAAVLGGIDAICMPISTAYRGPVVVVAGMNHPHYQKIITQIKGGELATKGWHILLGIVELIGCSFMNDGTDLPWPYDRYAWTITQPRVFNKRPRRVQANHHLCDVRQGDIEWMTQGCIPAYDWLQAHHQREHEKHMARVNPDAIYGPGRADGFRGD